MHSSYLSPIIRQLRDQQIRLVSHERKVKSVDLAEGLLAELDPSRSYSCEYLYSRIADRKPDTPADVALVGKVVWHDLPLLIEDLSDAANVPVEAAGERVITTEELAKQFGVSTKTISRWRHHGLVSRRFILDGRKRVGFLQTSVERFVERNQERVRRGGEFSQLTDEERLRIFAWARDMVGAGAQRTEVLRRLARQAGRSIETIRYTLRQHDLDHPKSPIFPRIEGTLSEENRRRLYRAYRRGDTVESLARQFCQTKAGIRRMVAQARAERVRELPLDYIPNPQFDEVFSAEAESVLCAPTPADGQSRRRVRPPSGLPTYLAGLYEIPLLTADQERHLFRKMNYLKYKASRLLAGLDPERPRPALMDQIEKLYDESVAVKNEITRANLRLVVSIAKRYVGFGGDFFDLVSDGNMSLMQAVEKFDFARGNKFSTYASWALLRNFSRTIPSEHLRGSRFRTSALETLAATEDMRGSQHEEEQSQSQRERRVESLLKCLDGREQEIIARRFGLGQEPLKLREIGALMGVTKERVRQIEIRAMEKLRRAAGKATSDRIGIA